MADGWTINPEKGDDGGSNNQDGGDDNSGNSDDHNDHGTERPSKGSKTIPKQSETIRIRSENLLGHRPTGVFEEVSLSTIDLNLWPKTIKL